MFIKNTKRGLLLLSQQNKQKCFFYLGFFAARAFTLQSGQNHGLGKFAPLLRTRQPCASAKYPYAPANRTFPPSSAHSHPKLSCGRKEQTLARA